MGNATTDVGAKKKVNGGVELEDPRPPVVVQDGQGPLAPFVPGTIRAQTLLSSQYVLAIRDLLGEAAAAKVVAPSDAAVSGFDSIGASSLSLAPLAISRYEESARAAVEAALADPARKAALYGCTPASTADTACLSKLIAAFGRRAFRRTLDPAELEAWVELGRGAAAQLRGFDQGAALALSGILQSPSFLYVVPDREVLASDPGRERLRGPELATRLSLFLFGTLPDEAWLAAAEAGALDAPEALRADLRQRLSSPAATVGLARFFDEAFALEVVPTMKREGEAGELSQALAQDMRTEAMTLLQTAFTGGTDFREVMSADYTYVNAGLATFYGLRGVTGTSFQRVALPASTGRAGLLGQGAFLAGNAHRVTTSPTLRGKYIRERLLCDSMPPPPPGTDTSSIATPPATPLTMRDRLATHRENVACAGCHEKMDTLGLALEHFDATGKHREQDRGLALDTAMTSSDLGTFSSPRELGIRLHDDPRFTYCLSRRLFRAAAGRIETDGESTPLRESLQRFVDSGYDARELLVELLSNRAFHIAAVAP